MDARRKPVVAYLMCQQHDSGFTVRCHGEVVRWERIRGMLLKNQKFTKGAVMVGTDTKLLVLGLGSTLLRDDGIGLLLLRAVEDRAGLHWRDRVEFVDGGAQGL